MLDDESFTTRDRRLPVHGVVDERFRGVLDAYLENFDRDSELGSAVSVVVEGETVVDIWGGWIDEERSREWERDTLVCMMSVAKGITAIAFQMLVDRGLIDLDAPVADYWPEFAQNGKEGVLVRWVLDHRAGLPVLTTDKLWPGAMFDREAMVDALARQAPLWEPGTVAAYHVHTQGYLLGEIMRRVTGSTVGPFVREEIASPLAADYWIGLPETELARCAELRPNMDTGLFAAATTEPPDALRSLAFAQNPPWPMRTTLNSREWRESEIASASGHGNARSVARIYAALSRGGELDGVRLMSSDSVRRMATVQHEMRELLQERDYRQGLGVLLNSPDAVYMGPNPAAFGHHGIGGSIGFADPDAQLAFSYSMNRMHAVGTNGPRARRLIDAVYAAL
ncbi:serine hydrolase domain-containing protein [Lysinimonas soli]|uniref:Serine hydrolase domain-containing protein n=1 Tax=Lysinimonas soli TaxID=1074233 RepID=A0ABW0NR82_9MICO